MKPGTISFLKFLLWVVILGAIVYFSQQLFSRLGGWLTFFAIVLFLALAVLLTAGLGYLLGGKKPKGKEGPEERGKEEKRPRKRGWILFWSFVLEAFVAAVFFLPVPIIFFWFPTAGLIFAVAAGVVAALLVLGVGFFLVYFWWAPNNLFFTFVPEGRAKIVVRGDALDETLLQWAGYSLAEEYVPADPDVEGSVAIDVGDVVEGGSQGRLLGGLRFYGLWPICDIFVYDFGWTNITMDNKIVPHPKQPMDYVLLKDDVYYAEVKAAEDKNLLPLDVGLVLRLRVVNPAKAIFKVQNWLEAVVNLVEPAVRFVISTDTYDHWVCLPKDLGEGVFEKLVSEGLVEELRLRYGIEVVSMGVKSFDPSAIDSVDGARQATLKQYYAEQEAKRIVTEATARAEEVRLLGKGTADAIKATQDLGPDAMQLGAVQAMAGNGNTTFVLPGDGKPVSLIMPSPGEKGTGAGAAPSP